MADQKIRLAAVSYLNTKPLIYGLIRSDLSRQIDLSLDIPSVCAQKLLNDEVDVALTPVAIIPELGRSFVVSDFCIGAIGAVKTVCLFSQVPLTKIRRIYLDFHSRTSVALVQVLCREYWNIAPEFVPAGEGFEQQLGGTTAAVIIGDRAIGLERRFRHTYDLGEAWTAWTGLPFVFAAWVSRRPLEPGFIERFNAAMAMGLAHLPELMKILPTWPNFDLEDYYRQNISYRLDDAKWAGLTRFLELLGGQNRYRLERQTMLVNS